MWERYYQPRLLGRALELANQHRDTARIIAGGTDLLVEMRRGMHRAPTLIDLTRVMGLDEIRRDQSGTIHLGAAVTHSQVAASRMLRRYAYPLVQACWQVGTPALRNRATVVGNLVTASPANDTIPALLALGARVKLSCVQGDRWLDLEGFYQGLRHTALQAGEIVTEIAVQPLKGNQRGAFVKLGLRRTHAIALVNAAVVLSMEGHRVAEARIALGSVAPTVIRARDAETALVGSRLDEEAIGQTAERAACSAVPITDVRGGAAYRRKMVRVLVQRALIGIRDGAAERLVPLDPPLLWGRTDGRYPDVGAEVRGYEGRDDQAIVCTVNGQTVEVSGAGQKTLLAMLREDLRLTGSKEGCGEGECGSCTVWLDGMAVLACLVPAPRAHGTRIVTVEGLADGNVLHPVQQAFIDEGAVQCGYCTPGFVMASANLLEEIPRPTREQITAAISGNLCRCTGYDKIVRAIERAALAQDQETAL